MRFALALALLLIPASLARAQDAEQQLDGVRELIAAARFGDAVGASRAVLDRDDLSAFDRNSALELLAVAQIAAQDDGAQQTLQLLYARDPGHRLGDADASPPVLSAFARARESAPEPVPVRIQHSPPQLTVRESPAIRVTIAEGGDAVSEVHLNYRVGGEGASRVVMTARGGGLYTARIPLVGDPSQPRDIAYHIVAMAPSLTPLDRVGSEAQPLQLRIPAEGAASDGERPPILSQDAPPPEQTEEGGGSVLEEWWFWTLIVVLVGGGVGVALGVALSESPQEGTLGSARLMLTRW